MDWKEVDNAKPDGISVQIIMGSILYSLIFSFNPGHPDINIILFLVLLFFLLAYVGHPYGRRIELWLFGSKNVFIRRLAIISIKGLAVITAIIAGISNLSNVS